MIFRTPVASVVPLRTQEISAETGVKAPVRSTPRTKEPTSPLQLGPPAGQVTVPVTTASELVKVSLKTEVNGEGSSVKVKLVIEDP